MAQQASTGMAARCWCCGSLRPRRPRWAAAAGRVAGGGRVGERRQIGGRLGEQLGKRLGMSSGGHREPTAGHAFQTAATRIVFPRSSAEFASKESGVKKTSPNQTPCGRDK